jgi:hypothetical protein
MQIGFALAGDQDPMQALTYLWLGAFTCLLAYLLASLERRKLERSARKRAASEKWSWEYEAKRRVEEMKSAP